MPVAADPDTLALLSDKTRQALEARSAAAAAQQAITQLTLEQGARQAEAQDARRQLAALAALLPSPLPPAVAAFEGGGEEAHARLADLQAQLAATQAFLQRAAALQQGSELRQLLSTLHKAQAARPDMLPPTKDAAKAAMAAAVAGEGRDIATKCEAALMVAKQLVAAAQAVVADGAVPALERLVGELERDAGQQSLRAEQLQQEIESYRLVAMYVFGR